MDSTKSTKPQLRKLLQQARLNLTPEDRAKKSTTIAEKLLQAVNWPVNPEVHCFEPIMRLGEVDLVDFVVALQADEADIRVYTSRKLGGEWQIVSADTDKPVVIPKFDVIIVPMLGFDTSLHRVGYGGGYYDRLLASQPNAQKIGVCYEKGRVEQIPTEPHDIPLNMIITESHIYTP
jgi:5,10-methenyltetrahydrofolate synthetase